jgi:hypothetical protein
MPEHLRALVVVMGLALPFWFVFSRYAVPALMTPAEFSVRSKLWVLISLAAFLSHNYWLFVLFAGLLLLALGQKDPDKVGLFMVLFLVVPPFYAMASGFGVLTHLIELNYYRVLVLVVLLPAWASTDTPADRKFGRSPVDWAVVGLGLLFVFDSEGGQGLTYLMRQGVYWFIDMFLPYRCMTVLNRQANSVSKTMTAFVVGVMILALIGVFETLKGWLLYSSLPGAMGLHWGMGGYMMRDGAMRASATTGHAIIFGFVLVVALAFYIRTADAVQSKWLRRLGLALLVGGLIASMSRGPWVGAVAVLLVWVVFGGAFAKRLKLMLMVGLPATVAIVASPMGEKVINLIPFLGNVHAETVTYRQDLFFVALNVIMVFPVLGPPQYFAAQQMQSMVQGEGIIDIVNSYIGIGLAHGLTGVFLFCGAFLMCGWYVVRTMRRYASSDDAFKEASALLAALVGVLISIATLSSLDAVPMTYWMLAGLCVAHHFNRAAARTASTAQDRGRDNSAANNVRLHPQRGW